ncbi:lipoyl(octanoyl) transferase LipB [Nitrincola alkalilacustris]|uniref:lipoyl(octanoyl) transferase LipB n=1 Tax=Nitrincola alkalilacustris TaxID=1571224 RepID=UPI00124F3EBC|nr:lipoyl(octanoyl) transferase LipB [Nitrincola alkalilacustris]
MSQLDVTNVADQLILRNLGLQAYEPIWRRMQAFTDQRGDDTPDEIWCLEHQPVYTQGQAGKPEHLLNPGDIPVVQVDRGGQVTYHGPGQLVVYLLLNLRRRKLGVRDVVTLMENAVIELLSLQGVTAAAKPDAPGVYVAEAKIASLGLRVRRGCSFHGLALNVAMDLEPFQRINPCGYAGMPMAQLAGFSPDITVQQAADTLLDYLCTQIGYTSISRASSLDEEPLVAS